MPAAEDAALRISHAHQTTISCSPVKAHGPHPAPELRRDGCHRILIRGPLAEHRVVATASVVDNETSTKRSETATRVCCAIPFTPAPPASTSSSRHSRPRAQDPDALLIYNDYNHLFRLFDQFSDLIERVSFWNLHDGQSWLNHFPWNRVNYPLLFDRNRRPKPAFDAVYATLRSSRSAHAPVERREPDRFVEIARLDDDKATEMLFSSSGLAGLRHAVSRSVKRRIGNAHGRAGRGSRFVAGFSWTGEFTGPAAVAASVAVACSGGGGGGGPVGRGGPGGSGGSPCPGGGATGEGGPERCGSGGMITAVSSIKIGGTPPPIA